MVYRFPYVPSVPYPMKNLLLLASLLAPSAAFAHGPFVDSSIGEAPPEDEATQSAREKLAADPNNSSLKMRLASQLTREGENEEALELLLWCWDHGTDPPNQSFSGVRVSFLLSKFMKLAETYEPAMSALVERRDSAKKAVLSPKPSWESARDLVRLNDNLGDQALTLKVYDQLQSRAKEAKVLKSSDLDRTLGYMFQEVTPMLIEAGRYDDVVEGFGNPSDWLNGEVRKHKVLEESMKDIDPEVVGRFRKRTVTEGSQMYLAYLGAGGYDASAAELAAKLVEFAPAVGTWKALIKGAETAKRDEVAASLRAKAKAFLSEADYEKIALRPGK